MDCPTLIDLGQNVITDKNANTSDIDTMDHLKEVVAPPIQAADNNGKQGEPRSEPVELKEVLLTPFSRLSRNLTYSDSVTNQRDQFEGCNFTPFLIPGGDRSLRGFSLIKFITAGIASQLKSLGVDELDCKEYIDAWLAHRRQRRWSQTAYKSASIFPSKGKTVSNSGLHHVLQQMGLNNPLTEQPSELRTSDFFSRSEPNSSLLRLSGEGNVELGQFLTRMEEVRGHINNATCNLLQSISLLMLPYLKLLNGNELETTNLDAFIESSIGIVMLMAFELTKESQKETTRMVEREFRKLQSEVKELYGVYSRLLKKFKKVFQENNEGCEKALLKIHPRGLTPLKKGRVDKNNQSSDQTQSNTTQEIEDFNSFLKESCRFSQIPVYQATFTPADIFKNHIFFAKSKRGNLVYKTNFEEVEWSLFSDLTSSKQKELFLTAMEDLHWCLENSISSVNKVKELVKQGYPENIHSKIRENLAYLKTLAKNPDEVLVLSKVTIVNQVNALREAAGRIIRVLGHVSTISKYYFKYVQYVKREATGSLFISPRKPVHKSNAAINTDRVSLKYDSFKVKLLIPFPMSTDPF